MLKRRLQAVFVPATTFIIGILVQSLFDQWITNKNIILLSLTVLFFSLVVILLFLAHLSTQSSNIDAKLSDLIEHSSLNMRYIEDDIDGQSYREATKLLEDIQHHLIVVGNWELFPDYRVNNTSVNTGESSAIQ